MAMIALGTLASAATMFAATAVCDGRFFFDAFTAVQLGAMLVAASASEIARPAFFAFSGGEAPGGEIGAQTRPIALGFGWATEGAMECQTVEATVVDGTTLIKKEG